MVTKATLKGSSAITEYVCAISPRDHFQAIHRYIQPGIYSVDILGVVSKEWTSHRAWGEDRCLLCHTSGVAMVKTWRGDLGIQGLVLGITMIPNM